MSEMEQFENEIEPIAKEMNLSIGHNEETNQMSNKSKDSLIKTYSEMVSVDDNLQIKRDMCREKFCNEIQLNYGTTAKEKNIETINDKYKSKISSGIDIIHVICKDYDRNEKRLTSLEERINDLNVKRLKQMSEFCKNVNNLAELYENFDTDMNLNNIEEDISRLNCKGSLLKSEIDVLKKGIDWVKRLINETEIDPMMNVVEMTKILKKETEKFDDVKTNRQLLRDLTSQVNMLKRKIDELD